MKKALWLLLMVGLFGPKAAKATHIIGGEIYYDCLGNNQFRITLKLYRDCLLGQAPFDSPANVALYKASGELVSNIELDFPGSQELEINALTPCYQDNAQVCVEEAIYTKVVTLSPTPGGYTLAYQRCCRNESILNIFNPGDTGSTYTIQIPESAFTDCNSSPRYNVFPPIVLCINDPLIFDHGASDPDGDSLVYTLCNPFEGASTTDPMPIPPAAPPYNFVNFIPPYSANNPLASTPPAAVDPVNGQLSGFPTLQGQFVVAVCVSEYRNGVLLSTNKRDFQFNVINCNGISIADFSAPSADVNLGSVCNGLMVNFVNESAFSSFYQWDFGVPGVGNDISTLPNPTYVYPDTGAYTVMLISNPGYNCADTAFLEIQVYHELEADIPLPDPQCITGNSFDFIPGGQFQNGDNFLWTFGGPSSSLTSTIQSPQNISWSEAGTFPVTLQLSNPHCTAFDSTVVTVYPLLSVDFSVEVNNVCEPAWVRFTNESMFSPGASFFWNFGDGTTSELMNPIHQYTEPGLYDVSLTVQNITGCTDTLTLTEQAFMTVRPSPDAGVSVTPAVQSILTPKVTFSDLSEGALDTWLIPEDDIEISDPNTDYWYSKPGTYNAAVVAVNEAGCYDTAMVKVKIEPIFAFYVPNAFSPNDDGVNDDFSPKGEGIATYEMIIYDRWGEEIYRSDAMTERWDGRAKDGRKVAQSGVYTYKIKVLDVQKTEHQYLGRVTLVR
jgi:gliding motility-associated-like protein